MSDQFWKFMTCLALGAMVVGIAWAIAWGSANQPVISAEQECASHTYQSQFCLALLNEKTKTP